MRSENSENSLLEFSVFQPDFSITNLANKWKGMFSILELQDRYFWAKNK